jgi:hypothetical protein
MHHVGYDLNVWDEGLHNDRESNWKITVHQLMQLDTGAFATGPVVEGAEFTFTPEEAKQLTLGVAEEDGGLYTWDTDFFIDAVGFVGIYEQHLPERVLEFVEKYM